MKKSLAIIMLCMSIIPLWAISIDYYQDSVSACFKATLYEKELPCNGSREGQPVLCFTIYEPVKASGSLSWLKKADLPAEPVVHSAMGMERKQACWDVSFCPYVKRNGVFYHLVSFEWDWQPATRIIQEESSQSTKAITFSAATKSALNDPSRYAAHSILSSGKWLKISIPSTGIHSLPFKYLEDNGINPAKAQIYGYGGRLLEEDFSKPYTDDLPVLPVYRDEKNKRLVFYGLGPCNWTYSSAMSMYVRENNHYSSSGYYLVGEREEGTLTVSELPSETSAVMQSNGYTDFQLHEKDLINLGSTGRECFGEDFLTTAKQTFQFDMTDALTTETSKLSIEFVASNTTTSSITIYKGNEFLDAINISAISSDNYYTYAKAVQCNKTFVPESDTDMQISLSFKSNGGSAKAANLNYIMLNVRKALNMRSDVLLFRDPESVQDDACCKYTLLGADESVIVFDVTNPADVKRILGSYSNGTYTFSQDCSILHEYAAVKMNGTLSEANIEGIVQNQDLHGLPQQQLVIITPPIYLEYAEKLAKEHREHDGIDVAVVTSEQVYNEFSSGTPDATAYRRFMKMFYDRADSEKEIPQSLLLFGDGVYDNRMVTNTFAHTGNQSEKLLVYESKESLEGTVSFVSDDYFGFLDDTEGVDLASDKLDIGIGRFPVNSTEEASVAVKKATIYMQNSDNGPWKNRLCFMADDGDDNSHAYQANTLADNITTEYPGFIANKIYVDAYERVSTASGETTPGANKHFKDLLSSGLLLLNYNGHGSTTAWSDQELLTFKDIQEMRNTRLPLWITATCDFCRYDDSEKSGGEYVFTNGNGGAIALVTTSRVVYSGQNFTFNKAIASYLFKRNGDKKMTLGEIMCNAKKATELQHDHNKLNFTLIGDPAIELAYPDYKAAITKINGHEIDAVNPDTAKAMDIIKMEGIITDREGNLAESFNGTVYPSVYDAAATAKTLGNAGEAFTYTDRSNILHSGKATVSNGRFSFSFIVPDDQSYSYGKGMINLYACNEKTFSSDDTYEAQGYFEDFVLGGTQTGITQDTIGPEIHLYINDFGFKDGDRVNTSPTLIATLNDPNGLNTSSAGIGHDIVLTLDQAEQYILNSVYESDLNSCTSGCLYYNLSELDEGVHTISLKAWDMQNNSNSASISFRVIQGVKPVVEDVAFYQTASKAWFTFRHNRPEMWMSATMEVCDLTGRIIWQSTDEIYNRADDPSSMEWDYTGKGGMEVCNGTYICRLSVDCGDGAQCVASRKIMLTAQ